jgi:hypothetical protein
VADYTTLMCSPTNQLRHCTPPPLHLPPLPQLVASHFLADCCISYLLIAFRRSGSHLLPLQTRRYIHSGFKLPYTQRFATREPAVAHEQQINSQSSRNWSQFLTSILFSSRVSYTFRCQKINFPASTLTFPSSSHPRSCSS